MAMSKALVIVESPAKAKTIEKYLGKGFEVRASIGHIMDLPKNDIGVEVKNRTFEPELIVSPEKEKVVDQLKKLAAKADEIYLAPDPDREGEAIAYHLALQLGTNAQERRYTAQPSTKSPRRPCRRRSTTPGILTKILFTRSRRGACSIVWWATRYRRCYGIRFA